MYSFDRVQSQSPKAVTGHTKALHGGGNHTARRVRPLGFFGWRDGTDAPTRALTISSGESAKIEQVRVGPS